jgi:threonine dehydrogenase-like Zn-dependent dehydrogenase
MKALVYHGPGKREWEEKPRPTILEPSDAIVRIAMSTICGTDLHFEGRFTVGDRGAHSQHGGWILGNTLDGNSG